MDFCGVINAQKRPAQGAPEKRRWSISQRPAGERSEGGRRVVWMRRARFSPCGKEVKARVNLSPLQQLKGHSKGKVMLHLLFAESFCKYWPL